MLHPPRILSIHPTFNENIPAGITYTRLPEPDEFVYEWRFVDDTLVYYGEAGDFVRFFAYNGPSRGYGGQIFPLRTANGTHILQGPWSSREGVVHQAFPDKPPIIATTDGFVSSNAVHRLGHSIRTTTKFGNEPYAYVSS